MEAQLFDGTILEFPDGTDPAVIQRVVKQHTDQRKATPTASPAAAPTPRDTTAVQSEYDAMPWYQKAATAADDVVRGVANGATFGYADKLAGYMNGDGTAAERAKTQEATDRGGGAMTAAKITGAIATPVMAGRAGLTLPGIASGVGGVTGALSRTGLAGVEGVGYGAADAKGNDTDLARGMISGGLFGAGGQAVGEALTSGARAVAGAFNPRPVVPTADQVGAEASRAFQAADNSGVMFSPQAAGRLQNDVNSSLAGMGYDPALQPGAAAIVRRLQDLQGQNITVQGLDTLRKVASNGYIAGNRANNSAVTQIIDHIDDLVANPQAGEVLGGNTGQAAADYGQARELWSRLAKARTVETAAGRGEMNAAASGSGANMENTSRQAMKGIASNPRLTRGYSDDEAAALARTIAGSADQNTLRLLGKMAPTGIVSGGGGIGGGAAVGSMVGGPVGAAVGALAAPVVGTAARLGANRMQENAVDELLNIIMAGGQRSAVVAPPNAVQTAIDTNRDDVIRAIFGAGQYGAQQNAQRR